MTLKGTASRYGTLAIGLHWVSAAAILLLLLLGFLAAYAPSEAWAATLLRVHVPLGTLVLALTTLRIVWWLFDRRPGDLIDQPRWQALAAHGVHTLLYAVLAVMGTSGIALLGLSGAAGRLFFGSSQPLPHFADFAPMLLHMAGAFLLLALMCVHIGAALFHQLVMRDHLFARMGLGSKERSS